MARIKKAIKAIGMQKKIFRGQIERIRIYLQNCIILIEKKAFVWFEINNKNKAKIHYKVIKNNLKLT